MSETWASDKEISDISGLPLARIRQLKREGFFMVSGSGRIDRNHALDALGGLDADEHVSVVISKARTNFPVEKKRVPKPPEDKSDELSDAKKRLEHQLMEQRIMAMRVDSDARLQRNARDAGMLVLASQVEQVWRDMTTGLLDERLVLHMVSLAERSENRRDLTEKFDALVNELRSKLRALAIKDYHGSS